MSDGFTPYQSRFLKNFKGPVYPFGCEVQYKPSSPKELAAIHNYGEKILSGIFVGYSERAGGEWNGDLLIADWDQIENAERAADVKIKRCPASEVKVCKLNGKFRFPVKEGSLKQPPSNSTHAHKRASNLE